MIADAEAVFYGWTVQHDEDGIQLRFIDPITGNGEAYWMEPEDAVDIAAALLQAGKQ